MKDQLIRYVDLLFAGATDAYEMKQEILQNTLDRYDDLIAQGKSPEAAYRLAISGIGDINEILGGEPNAVPVQPSPQTAPEADKSRNEKKFMRAVAVAFYILCPVPLFILGDEIGLCFVLLLVAAATALIIMAGKVEKEPKQTQYYTQQPVNTQQSAQQELRKSIHAVIWAIGLSLYFIVSFSTQAWYITWVIFLITPSVQGLVTACMDLREAK